LISGASQDCAWITGHPHLTGRLPISNRSGGGSRRVIDGLPVPPKYAVSQVVGFMKGKSAIHLARVYGERKQKYAGQSFWARGYFVSTIGRDEATIREYIRNQKKEDQRIDQMNLWK